jgi:adenylosuccinate lyase
MCNLSDTEKVLKSLTMGATRMKKFLSLALIASCFVSIAMFTSEISEAKAKSQVNKIKSYNPEQRKKLFEWALKECSKQYGGAGYSRPEINYVTGKIMCFGL